MKEKSLVAQDAQQIWNKLNQLSDKLDKLLFEIKHLRRDVSDLEDKIED